MEREAIEVIFGCLLCVYVQIATITATTSAPSSCLTSSESNSSGGWMQYPITGTYPNNLDCTWTISAPVSSQYIFLTVRWRDIEDCTTTISGIKYICTCDHLTFSGTKLNAFCGVSNVSANIMFAYDQVPVRFISNSANKGNGFYISYIFYSSASGCDPFSIVNDSSSGGSLQYPAQGQYPSLSNCTWTIGTNNTQMCMIITVVWKDIENDTNCVYDSLKLDTLAGSTLQKLCGTSSVVSTNTYLYNQIRVKFTSDGNLNGNGFHLNYTYRPVSGEWVDWSAWGTCNATCGGGKQTRNRTCINCCAATCSSKNCIGSSIDELDCNTDPCPANGEWSKWSLWGACNATCGGGTAQRKRNCTQPVPIHREASCSSVDVSIEFHTCNIQTCPGNGAMTRGSIEIVTFFNNFSASLAVDSGPTTYVTSGLHQSPWLRMILSTPSLVREVHLEGLHVFNPGRRSATAWLYALEGSNRRVCNSADLPAASNLVIKCVAPATASAIEIQIVASFFTSISVCEFKFY